MVTELNKKLIKTLSKTFIIIKKKTERERVRHDRVHE